MDNSDKKNDDSNDELASGNTGNSSKHHDKNKGSSISLDEIKDCLLHFDMPRLKAMFKGVRGKDNSTGLSYKFADGRTLLHIIPELYSQMSDEHDAMVSGYEHEKQVFFNLFKLAPLQAVGNVLGPSAIEDDVLDKELHIKRRLQKNLLHSFAHIYTIKDTDVDSKYEGRTATGMLLSAIPDLDVSGVRMVHGVEMARAADTSPRTREYASRWINRLNILRDNNTPIQIYASSNDRHKRVNRFHLVALCMGGLLLTTSVLALVALATLIGKKVKVDTNLYKILFPIIAALMGTGFFFIALYFVNVSRIISPNHASTTGQSSANIRTNIATEQSSVAVNNCPAFMRAFATKETSAEVSQEEEEEEEESEEQEEEQQQEQEQESSSNASSDREFMAKMCTDKSKVIMSYSLYVKHVVKKFKISLDVFASLCHFPKFSAQGLNDKNACIYFINAWLGNILGSFVGGHAYNGDIGCEVDNDSALTKRWQSSRRQIYVSTDVIDYLIQNPTIVLNTVNGHIPILDCLPEGFYIENLDPYSAVLRYSLDLQSAQHTNEQYHNIYKGQARDEPVVDPVPQWITDLGLDVLKEEIDMPANGYSATMVNHDMPSEQDVNDAHGNVFPNQWNNLSPLLDCLELNENTKSFLDMLSMSEDCIEIAKVKVASFIFTPIRQMIYSSGNSADAKYNVESFVSMLQKMSLISIPVKTAFGIQVNDGSFCRDAKILSDDDDVHISLMSFFFNRFLRDSPNASEFMSKDSLQFIATMCSLEPEGCDMQFIINAISNYNPVKNVDGKCVVYKVPGKTMLSFGQYGKVLFKILERWKDLNLSVSLLTNNYLLCDAVAVGDFSYVDKILRYLEKLNGNDVLEFAQELSMLRPNASNNLSGIKYNVLRAIDEEFTSVHRCIGGLSNNDEPYTDSSTSEDLGSAYHACIRKHDTFSNVEKDHTGKPENRKVNNYEVASLHNSKKLSLKGDRMGIHRDVIQCHEYFGLENNGYEFLRGIYSGSGHGVGGLIMRNILISNKIPTPIKKIAARIYGKYGFKCNVEYLQESAYINSYTRFIASQHNREIPISGYINRFRRNVIDKSNLAFATAYAKQKSLTKSMHASHDIIDANNSKSVYEFLVDVVGICRRHRKDPCGSGLISGPIKEKVDAFSNEINRQMADNGHHSLKYWKNYFANTHEEDCSRLFEDSYDSCITSVPLFQEYQARYGSSATNTLIQEVSILNLDMPVYFSMEAYKKLLEPIFAEGPLGLVDGLKDSVSKALNEELTYVEHSTNDLDTQSMSKDSHSMKQQGMMSMLLEIRGVDNEGRAIDSFGIPEEFVPNIGRRIELAKLTCESVTFKYSGKFELNKFKAALFQAGAAGKFTKEVVRGDVVEVTYTDGKELSYYIEKFAAQSARYQVIETELESTNGAARELRKEKSKLASVQSFRKAHIQDIKPGDHVFDASKTDSESELVDRIKTMAYEHRRLYWLCQDAKERLKEYKKCRDAVNEMQETTGRIYGNRLSSVKNLLRTKQAKVSHSLARVIDIEKQIAEHLEINDSLQSKGHTLSEVKRMQYELSVKYDELHAFHGTLQSTRNSEVTLNEDGDVFIEKSMLEKGIIEIGNDELMNSIGDLIYSRLLAEANHSVGLGPDVNGKTLNHMDYLIKNNYSWSMLCAILNKYKYYGTKDKKSPDDKDVLPYDKDAFTQDMLDILGLLRNAETPDPTRHSKNCQLWFNKFYAIQAAAKTYDAPNSGYQNNIVNNVAIIMDSMYSLEGEHPEMGRLTIDADKDNELRILLIAGMIDFVHDRVIPEKLRYNPEVNKDGATKQNEQTPVVPEDFCKDRFGSIDVGGFVSAIKSMRDIKDKDDAAIHEISTAKLGFRYTRMNLLNQYGQVIENLSQDGLKDIAVTLKEKLIKMREAECGKEGVCHKMVMDMNDPEYAPTFIQFFAVVRKLYEHVNKGIFPYQEQMMAVMDFDENATQEVSTGGGKTLITLLQNIAKSIHHGAPVLSVCHEKQLVKEGRDKCNAIAKLLDIECYDVWRRGHKTVKDLLNRKNCILYTDPPTWCTAKMEAEAEGEKIATEVVNIDEIDYAIMDFGMSTTINVGSSDPRFSQSLFIDFYEAVNQVSDDPDSIMSYMDLTNISEENRQALHALLHNRDSWQKADTELIVSILGKDYQRKLELAVVSCIKEFLQKTWSTQGDEIAAEMAQKLEAFTDAELRQYLRSVMAAKSKEPGKDYEVIVNHHGDYEVKIYERSTTGRINDSSVWSNGVHMFVSIREKGNNQSGRDNTKSVEITPLKINTSSCDMASVLGEYRHKSGSTGTPGEGIEAVIHKYVIDVDDIEGIPMSRADELYRSNMLVLSDKESYKSALFAKAEEAVRNKRPIMFYCNTLQEIKDLSDYFQSRKLANVGGAPDGWQVAILDDYNKMAERNKTPRMSEEEIINQYAAGAGPAVIIATAACGRGTDIKGLQEVVITSLDVSERVRRQIQGRTARNGRFGMSSTIICDPGFHKFCKEQKAKGIHVTDPTLYYKWLDKSNTYKRIASWASRYYKQVVKYKVQTMFKNALNARVDNKELFGSEWIKYFNSFDLMWDDQMIELDRDVGKVADSMIDAWKDMMLSKCIPGSDLFKGDLNENKEYIAKIASNTKESIQTEFVKFTKVWKRCQKKYAHNNKISFGAAVDRSRRINRWYSVVIPIVISLLMGLFLAYASIFISSFFVERIVRVSSLTIGKLIPKGSSAKLGAELSFDILIMLLLVCTILILSIALLNEGLKVRSFNKRAAIGNSHVAEIDDSDEIDGEPEMVLPVPKELSDPETELQSDEEKEHADKETEHGIEGQGKAGKVSTIVSADGDTMTVDPIDPDAQKENDQGVT